MKPSSKCASTVLASFCISQKVLRSKLTLRPTKNVYIDRFGSFWHPSTSAPKTPLWAQNAHPKPIQERNGGVEDRFRYTEAGFNDYFNFPSSLRVNLIELQSGYAILALPNA